MGASGIYWTIRSKWSPNQGVEVTRAVRRATTVVTIGAIPIIGAVPVGIVPNGAIST